MKRAAILMSLLAMTACVPMKPPPPPPPLPPVPPIGLIPKAFTVYFPWNRSGISREGMAILSQAANAYRAGGAVTVQVTGFTDTSGSADDNQRLSVERAEHVAHILSRMGVPLSTLTVQGRGENDLAVPIPDGRREARDRRVTIIE